jgi:hypothetical protein
MPSQFLGSGYNTDLQMPTAIQCINNTNVVYNSGIQGGIGFSYYPDVTGLASLFGLSMWYQVGGLPLDPSIGIEVGLLSALEGSLLVQSELYTQSIQCPTISLIPAGYGIQALNPYGQAMYNMGPVNFRAVCGDQFVSQVNNGGILITAVLLTFANTQYVLDFQAKDFGQAAAMGLNALWSSIVGCLNTIGGLDSIEIIAAQFGGNPTSLAPIFQNNEGVYFTTTCTVSTFSVCQDVMNALSTYSSQNFPSQINCTSDLSQLGYTYQPFSSLGLNTTVSIATPEVLTARNQVINIINAQTNLNTSLSSMLANLAPYMTPDVIADLNIAISQTIQNLNMIQSLNVTQACYQPPLNCTNVLTAIQQSLITPNNTFLNQFVGAYKLTGGGWGGAINAGFTGGIAFPCGNQNFYINDGNVNAVCSIYSNSDNIILACGPTIIPGSLMQEGIWGFEGTIEAPNFGYESTMTLIEISNPYFSSIEI